MRPVFSDRTEERDQKGNAEIGDAAVEDRYDGILRSCDAGEDREGGVEGRGAARRNRGQRPETARYPRCGQQREEFAQDVAEQSDRSQFDAAQFGDEDARQRIVAESRADGHGVGRRHGVQQRRYERRSGQRSDDGAEGQQRHAAVERADTFDERGVVSQRHADREHQPVEHVGAYGRGGCGSRNPSRDAENRSGCEEGDDHQTAAQCGEGRRSGCGGVGRAGASAADRPPQQPGAGDASRQRSRAEDERLHAERGQRPHDLFVAAHFRSQHEEQQPDDERDDAAERTERSAAQQAAREDAAEEDSEQNQHRQCGILRAKIGKKADGRKLCACGRRNEVRR